MPVEVIFSAVWLGFFAAGATALIRVLPLVVPLLERGVKPWICDFCMCFWLVLAGAIAVPFLATALHYTISARAIWFGAPAGYAVALFVLRKLTDPIGPPPFFGDGGGGGGIPELHDPNQRILIQTNFSDPPPAH